MPRWLVALLLLLVLAYLGLCGLLYAYQRSMIYFPQPAEPVAGVESRAWDMNGERMRIGVRAATGRRALLYFGGNAESVDHAAADLEAAFPDRALYLMHYRGYGGSSGQPSEAALVKDAFALYDAVQRTHPDIVVVGRSLGSGVAVQLASARRVSRLVLVTPFDSLLGIAAAQFPFVPVRLLLRDTFESSRFAPRVDAPTLLIAAEHDEVIPRASTDALRTRFRAGIADEAVIAGAGHNTVSASPRYRALLSGAAAP